VAGTGAGTTLFDSHLHLTADRFAPDLDEVVDRARTRGVRRMVTVASDPEDAEQAAALAARTPGLWATAGLHPHAADRTSASLMGEIERIAEAPEIVAIGETGLDFHYDNAARRAGKHMVMLVYEGENHGLAREPNQRDYQSRILQWFAHYLKGEPAPEWITTGVPWLEQKDGLRKKKVS